MPVYLKKENTTSFKITASVLAAKTQSRVSGDLISAATQFM